MPLATLIHGDALEALKTLPDEHVTTVVTSPPYLGQRDYGVEGQIGLETSMGEWLEKLVAVFDECKRVLKSQGNLWVNIGDCYNSSHSRGAFGDQSSKGYFKHGMKRSTNKKYHSKNLVGQPWELAFALREAGWIWRSTIPWIKRNPMPHNADDRPTNAHEFVLLFSKDADYFFDEFIMRTRYRLDWWEINTERGYWTEEVEHYAAYPVELPTRCVLLGSSGAGTCPECLTPLHHFCNKGTQKNNGAMRKHAETPGAVKGKTSVMRTGITYEYTDGGYGCLKCAEKVEETKIPSVILDPFSGTATTGVAAMRNGRDYIGLELKKAYFDLGRTRLEEDAPMFNKVEVLSI